MLNHEQGFGERGQVSQLSMNDQVYIIKAIEIARHSVDSGGGPFGAIVVRNGQIIGRGQNRVTLDNDPSAHAEIVAIRDACNSINGFTLEGCTIYSSCEPCPMCLSAIYWSHISRLVYSSTTNDAAASGFDDAHIMQQLSIAEKERKLDTSRLTVDETGKEFSDWKDKTDRVDY